MELLFNLDSGALNFQLSPDADTDVKVAVDSGAAADYIGAASNDGVLRTDATLDYADGGDYVTLGLDATLKSNYDSAYTHVSNDGTDHTYINQDLRTSASPTFVDLTLTSDLFTDNIKEYTGSAGITFHHDILANSDAALDIGDTTNYFRTLHLKNEGGNIIYCEGVQSGGPSTNYTIFGGGGQFGSDQNQGGTFKITMGDITSSLGTSTNQLILSPGRPDVFAAGTVNDVIFQAYNGISTYGFVSSFGGWNDSEYGLELRRIDGAEAIGKTLIFDNQIPDSDFRRSIDFRINSVNKLTIENTGEVVVTDRITAPRADITAIQSASGFGNAGVQALRMDAYLNFFGLNWFDYLTLTAQSTNLPSCLGMFPNGTATGAYVNAYNSSNTGATAWMSMGVTGGTADLLVRDFAQTTNITTLQIGSGGNDFPTFDVTCSTLTSIDFVYAGVIEAQLQPDTLVFNNGAVDTQIDWGTSGQLGLQVATNDILRLAATSATFSQSAYWADNLKTIFGTGNDVEMYYDGTDFFVTTDLQNPSDLVLDCGTDKTLELTETVWDDLKTPIGSLVLGTSPPDLGTFFGNLSVYLFDPDTDEQVYFTLQLPHDYKEGTDIKPHVHWCPMSTHTGNVVWKLEYEWENIAGTFGGGTTTITATQAGSGTLLEHQVANFTDISGTGKTISSMLVCRLYRDANDASDTFTADAGLIEFDLHYEKDTIGSRQTTAK